MKKNDLIGNVNGILYGRGQSNTATIFIHRQYGITNKNRMSFFMAIHLQKEVFDNKTGME